jgi:hypothetical protein
MDEKIQNILRKLAEIIYDQYLKNIALKKIKPNDAKPV